MLRFWIAILSLISFASTTSTQEKCDPNDQNQPYSAIVNGVDCAGGKGSGPAYVRGLVIVIGTDIYELDRDGDEIGCGRG